ncbi:hypothetical protein B0T20DRAFT_207123 [Sordaria brevicollis]|uniref:Uncharacterized protein n=1 Tax=Sordaria brevicollis TaxID=83679 RepID=A0AAE0UBU7_SORBR|nr:hypothetical protein B0T20DRAFT_207123 [Sordaria brevicollis]
MWSFTNLLALSLALATQAQAQFPPTSTAGMTSVLTNPLLPPPVTTTTSSEPGVPTGRVSECPIIISTTSICPTCMTIDCVTVKTVTAGCTCANPPMTVFQSWGCEKGCDALPGGCKTLWKVVSGEGCSYPGAATGSGGGVSTGSDPNGTTTITSSGSFEPTTTNWTSTTVLSISSGGGQPIGPINPSIPISTNAAGRRAVPFRFW